MQKVIMSTVVGAAKADRFLVAIYVLNHFAKSVFCEILVAVVYPKQKTPPNGNAIVVHLKK